MGTAPGQVLYVGKILATEPLLGSVGSHLGGLSQSDILRRTVGCAGVQRGSWQDKPRPEGAGVCVCEREAWPRGSCSFRSWRPGSLFICDIRLFTTFVHLKGLREPPDSQVVTPKSAVGTILRCLEREGI